MLTTFDGSGVRRETARGYVRLFDQWLRSAEKFRAVEILAALTILLELSHFECLNFGKMADGPLRAVIAMEAAQNSSNATRSLKRCEM